MGVHGRKDDVGPASPMKITSAVFLRGRKAFPSSQVFLLNSLRVSESIMGSSWVGPMVYRGAGCLW